MTAASVEDRFVAPLEIAAQYAAAVDRVRMVPAGGVVRSSGAESPIESTLYPNNTTQLGADGKGLDD
jgi:hypothetical protein